MLFAVNNPDFRSFLDGCIDVIASREWNRSWNFWFADLLMSFPVSSLTSRRAIPYLAQLASLVCVCGTYWTWTREGNSRCCNHRHDDACSSVNSEHGSCLMSFEPWYTSMYILASNSDIFDCTKQMMQIMYTIRDTSRTTPHIYISYILHQL